MKITHKSLIFSGIGSAATVAQASGQGAYQVEVSGGG
jgi:hypothetical protein